MTASNRIAPNDPSSWDTFKLQHLIPVGEKNDICLDLGCGPGVRAYFESKGYHYIGLDYHTVEGADIRGDAQSLPIRDNSINLLIAASSFEHFPDPWAAAREIYRTLKPGGQAVISLSFLEPYHAHSYFHMSHLGAQKLFQDSGFKIESIEPFEWSGIEASVQALYQIPPARWMATLIVRSTLFARRSLIKILIPLLRNNKKKSRAYEFLEEERFRFTAGIKLKLLKPES